MSRVKTVTNSNPTTTPLYDTSVSGDTQSHVAPAPCGHFMCIDRPTCLRAPIDALLAAQALSRTVRSTVRQTSSANLSSYATPTFVANIEWNPDSGQAVTYAAARVSSVGLSTALSNACSASALRASITSSDLPTWVQDLGNAFVTLMSGNYQQNWHTTFAAPRHMLEAMTGLSPRKIRQGTEMLSTGIDGWQLVKQVHGQQWSSARRIATTYRFIRKWTTSDEPNADGDVTNLKALTHLDVDEKHCAPVSAMGRYPVTLTPPTMTPPTVQHRHIAPTTQHKSPSQPVSPVHSLTLRIPGGIMGSAPMYDGKPCRSCGGTLRYVSGTKNCVACARTHAAKQRAEHPDMVLTYQAKYRDEHRDELRLTWRNYSNEHRDERRAYCSQWRIDHPDYSAHKLHPDRVRRNTANRRARKVGATIGPVDESKVFDSFFGLCHVCWKPVDPHDYHRDHILPLVHGGSHTQWNLAPTHPACNLTKNSWMSYTLVRRAMQLQVLCSFGIDVYSVISPVISQAVQWAAFNYKETS